MGKKPKKAQEPEPVELAELEDPDEEVLADLRDEDPPPGIGKTNSRGPVPKQAVNFDNKWIKENIKDHSIAQLLQAKREADEAGDIVGARKIRRTLRSRGFYVSKVKEEM